MLKKACKRIQPRLDPDVVDLVLAEGAKNGRTPVREVNHALREFYLKQFVTIDFSAIPPTYWTRKHFTDYKRTGIYPGTEHSAKPLIHNQEQIRNTLYGMERIAPYAKKRKARR